MNIWQEALAVQDYVVRCRRHIHENPELSDKEDNTVVFILAELNAMGIPCEDVPGGGVMAFIDGDVPGKTVLLRADIDALPMQEDPNNMTQPKVCVSKVPGVAHICGHDAHTAMLLGAAKILSSHREEIPGKIVLYFERGEEAGNGDYYMNKYLQDHHIHVDSAWAQHVRPSLPTGKVAIIDGGVYAGNTSYQVNILGENALRCGVALVNSLNTARMRYMTPFERVTLSTNLFQYDGNTCRVGGTCRYYDINTVGRPMRDAIYRIITETVAAYGCTTEKPVRKAAMTRGVINNPQCCDLLRTALADVIGKDNVTTSNPSMGAESFSILSAYYPSVMVSLGVGNPEKGMSANGHNPHFDPDEEAFQTGVATAVTYALAFLNHTGTVDFDPFVGDIDAYLASNRR